MADKTWRIHIEDNVESLKQQLIDLKSELTALSSKEYKIDLGIDSQELKSAVESINKLMTNLSKGSNNFKDFQNFTKQIKDISAYTKSLKELFNSNLGKNGGLITSINNIENSLNVLSSAINANASSFSNITNAQKKAASSIDSTNKEIDEQKKKLDNATEAQKKLNNAQKENNTAKSSSSNTSSFKNESQENKKVIETYESLIAKINEYKRLKTRNLGKDESLFNNDLVAANKLKTEIEELQSKLKLTESQLNNFYLKRTALDDGYFDDSYQKYMSYALNKANSNYQKYSNRSTSDQSTAYKKIIAEFESSYTQLNNLAQKMRLKNEDHKFITDDEIKQFEELRAACDRATNSLREMSSVQKGSKDVTRAKLFGNIDEYMARNTKLSKEFRAELILLKNQLSTLGADADVSNIVSQFERLKVKIREAGQEGQSFKAAIQDKAWYGFASQIGMMFSFYDVINIIRLGINNVIELNTNITELAKVSEASVGQLYDDFSSFEDIAKEVGGTISDTISATADWARSGYSIPDAKGLAEVSQIYKNVGDGIDIDEANESLISTLKGFQLDDLGDAADQAMHIVDVFNEVSNNQAISSAGIGEALQRSASSFNAANTSLEESVALITAANSVVQDPSRVGEHIADLYSNVMKIKVAISVNIQRWTRPSKDLHIFILINLRMENIYMR